MDCNTLVIIGASTGGPRTLRELLAKLPVLDACLLIIQHLPTHIAPSISKSLQRVTSMPVKLAEHGGPLKSGEILLAPGDIHTELECNQSIRLVEGEKVNFVRPSIDVAMKSLKSEPPCKFIGVILTGMGKDGVAGISHIKQLGGTTIAQDGASSVVFGMPKAAAATGDIDFVLSPERIGDKITELVQSWSS